MDTLTTNTPFEITRKDVESYVKMQLYTELTLIKEKLALFEIKYNCNFLLFEKSVTTAAEENFEHWDDYMEWKAFYNKYNLLKKRIA